MNALGPGKAADPAKAAASAAIFELARAAQAPEPATGPPAAPLLPTPATGTPPTDATLTAVPAIVTLPGAATAIASTAGVAKPTDAKPTDAKPTDAKPTDAKLADAKAANAKVVDAEAANAKAAGATNQPVPAPADSRTFAGAHGPSHRPAAPGSQAAGPGDQAAGPAPISAGLPAEPVTPSATAQAGTASGDAAVQAAQAPVAQPVPAGQPAASGSEPVHRHPAADQLPLARQLATPVLALRAGGDGSHQLIVALHPAELGPVNVHVRIQGDLMTIQLASTSESAHDALRDALPQLRSELQSAGLSTASLSLDLTSGDATGSGAFANPRQGAGEPARPAGAAPADPTPVAPRRSGDSRTNPYPSAGLDRWL